MPYIVNPIQSRGGGYGGGVPLSAFGGYDGVGAGLGAGIANFGSSIGDALRKAAEIKAESSFIDKRGEWEERLLRQREEAESTREANRLAAQKEITRMQGEHAEKLAKINNRAAFKAQVASMALQGIAKREELQTLMQDKRDQRVMDLHLQQGAELAGLYKDIYARSAQWSNDEARKVVERKAADYGSLKEALNTVKAMPELKDAETFRDFWRGNPLNPLSVGGGDTRKLIDRVWEEAKMIQDPRLRAGVMQEAVSRMRGFLMDSSEGAATTNRAAFEKIFAEKGAQYGFDPAGRTDWAREEALLQLQSLSPEERKSLSEQERSAMDEAYQRVKKAVSDRYEGATRAAQGTPAQPGIDYSKLLGAKPRDVVGILQEALRTQGAATPGAGPKVFPPISAEELVGPPNPPDYVPLPPASQPVSWLRPSSDEDTLAQLMGAMA